MCDCDNEYEEAAELERRTLIALLAINATMFVVELIAGWLAQTTGLLADSLDMLADALVYAIALYGVGRATRFQYRAATASGVLQMVLGAGVLVDVTRRLMFGSEPVSAVMVAVGAVAMAANVWCLVLVWKHRHGGVHMRASYIFSANDVIANIGVVVSGALVYLFDSRIPDLVVGAAIAALMVRGGVRILREVRTERDCTNRCS